MPGHLPPRRRVILLAGASLLTAAAPLPLRAACERGRTPAQTEGPYWKAGAPVRHAIRSDAPGGQPLLLQGRVLGPDCRPLDGAWLDFWQADAAGHYDNRGFGLRGRQAADAEGGFRLETVLPGAYPGRTRHIHVKVGAPGRAVLTTQLYFPDEPRNARDGLFRPELLVDLAPGGEAAEARFDFILGA